MTGPTGRPLRAAVVGCGDVSVVHLDAIAALPDSVLVGVVDPDPDRRTGTARRAGCAAFAELTDLLDATAPDVVHLCTPHHTHTELALPCLERGVSVLVEKPLAHTVASGERLAAAAAASTGLLGVCLQNRYNLGSVRLAELLASGTLGAVRGARAWVHWHRDADYYRRAPWRGRWAQAGGGVLMNQAVHTVDLLSWLLGPVDQVTGTVATLALPEVIEVEDTAALRLRHATATGPVFSVLHATTGHVEDAPVGIEIRTDRARAHLDDALTVSFEDGRTETVPAAAAVAPDGARAYWGTSHALLIADFHRHVRTATPYWIDAATGLAVLRTIRSVYPP